MPKHINWKIKRGVELDDPSEALERRGRDSLRHLFEKRPGRQVRGVRPKSSEREGSGRRLEATFHAAVVGIPDTLLQPSWRSRVFLEVEKAHGIATFEEAVRAGGSPSSPEGTGASDWSSPRFKGHRPPPQRGGLFVFDRHRTKGRGPWRRGRFVPWSSGGIPRGPRSAPILEGRRRHVDGAPKPASMMTGTIALGRF